MRFARWLLASALLSACTDSPDTDPSDSAVAPATDAGSDASRLDASPSLDASMLDARGPTPDASWDAALGSPYAKCDRQALPSDWGFVEVARADQFVADGRFVALDGHFALIASDSGPDVMIAVQSSGDSSAPRISQLTLPAGRRAVAVADTRTDSYGAWVLTCADTGGDCNLTTVVGGPQNDLRDATVAQAAGSDLGAYEPLGLAWASNGPCVFGSKGLSCLEDGHWAGGFLTPADDGDPIVDFQPGTVSLAVSRQGLVWFGTNTASTISFTQLTPLEPTLSGAVADQSNTFVFGHGSLWSRGADSAFKLVPIEGYVQAVWLSHAGLKPSFLLQSGLIVTPNEPGAYCWNLQLHASEPVLAASDQPCGLASNFRVITQHSLFSQNVCALD